MKTMLRSPAGPEGDLGSGPDNLGAGLMDSWGNGDAQQGGQTLPVVPPVPQQVTPPRRPQQSVISDNTPANQVQPQPSQQQVQPDPNAAQQQPPPPTGLSEADLQRIATTSAIAARSAVAPQQQQQQAPPPMTDAEFNTRYRVPQVDANVMAAIHDPDPAKGGAALNNLLKQTYTSALLMSNDLHQAEMSKMRGEMSPHIDSFRTFQQQQQKIALENEFYTANPTLSNEREIVNECIDSLQAKIQRGEIRPTTKAEAFRIVADASQKLLARMGGGGTPTTDGQQTQHTQTPPPPAQRRPAVATSQGRGSSGQPPNVSAMDKVMASWD